MDKLSKSERSKLMGRVRHKDTKPEMYIRRLVYSMGYRYRLHRSDLPGKPDLVFPGRRKIIFVHGCFWHMHPDEKCKLAKLPKPRLEFWIPKLRGNRERDIRNIKILYEKGWDCLEVWECQIKKKDKSNLEFRIRGFLSQCSQTLM